MLHKIAIMSTIVFTAELVVLWTHTYTAIWWCQKLIIHYGQNSKWRRTQGKIQVLAPYTNVDQVRSSVIFHGLF